MSEEIRMYTLMVNWSAHECYGTDHDTQGEAELFGKEAVRDGAIDYYVLLSGSGKKVLPSPVKRG